MSILSVMTVLLFSSCGETESKRRTTGYKGGARSNAFLAAQRLLGRYGYMVEQRSSLGDLNYGTSTVFLTPSSLNTVGRAKRVMEWVERGGHLVFMMDGGERTGNDFQMNRVSWSFFDEESSGMDYLFDELGVEFVDWATEPEHPSSSSLSLDDWEAMTEEDRVLLESEVSKFQLGGEELEIHHWAEKSLIYDVQYSEDVGSEDDADANMHRYLSLMHGGGRVTIKTGENLNLEAFILMISSVKQSEVNS